MSSISRREIYEAVVTNISDPEKRGRIRVKSRALVSDGRELPGWIEPCFPFAGANDAGWFAVPEPGSLVEIEMVVGSSEDDVPGMSVILHPGFRWRCALYSDTNDVPLEIRQSAAGADRYGKRLGLKTATGQYLVWDEETSETLLKFGKLRLGSESAGENLVLGQVFKAFAVGLLDGIVAHTHTAPSGGGPTTPPLNAATFTALKADPIQNENVLSGKSFAEK